jgi:hypothetical protein
MYLISLEYLQLLNIFHTLVGNFEIVAIFRQKKEEKNVPRYLQVFHLAELAHSASSQTRNIFEEKLYLRDRYRYIH